MAVQSGTLLGPFEILSRLARIFHPGLLRAHLRIEHAAAWMAADKRDGKMSRKGGKKHDYEHAGS